MSTLTQQMIDDCVADMLVIGRIINDAANTPNPPHANGTVTTRLGGVIRNFASLSVTAEPIESSASSISVAAGTDALVLNGASPTATAIALPPVGSQSVELTIVDLSTSVTEHVITLTPDGSEKIMGASTFTITSTAFDKARITLAPSTTINGWYIR